MIEQQIQNMKVNFEYEDELADVIRISKQIQLMAYALSWANKHENKVLECKFLLNKVFELYS